MILSALSSVAAAPLARKLVAVCVVFTAGLSAGFYGGVRWSAGELARVEAAHAAARAEQESANAAEVLKALTESREAAATVRRITKESAREADRLRLARDGAVTERDRLLDDAAAYQRRSAEACSAGPTGGGAATGVPTGVYDGSPFLRVLGECVGAHDALAYDLARTRLAVATCERSYGVAQGLGGAQP